MTPRQGSGPAAFFLAYARERAPHLLREIRDLVSIESPSGSPQCVNRAVDWVQERLESAGVETARISQGAAGDQLCAVAGGGRPAILLLGHLDTVWEQGHLDRMPVRQEGDRVYGPGIFDMKSGAVLMVEMLRLAAAGACPVSGPLGAFFSSDEETGSTASRRPLEEFAAGCRAVLVFEPSLPGGKAKTARKGVATYRLEISGRAAHAGVDPEAGVSAVEEFARQMPALLALAADLPGASINVGTVRGGTRSNVVPDHLAAEIDVRVASLRDAARIEERLRALAPSLAGASLKVSGGLNRPPLERTEAVAELYQRAAAVASQHGWTLGEGSTGGGSDGSFTAALGIPTLDGLGPEGDGAHAAHEHILASDLPRRLALAAQLLACL